MSGFHNQNLNEDPISGLENWSLPDWVNELCEFAGLLLEMFKTSFGNNLVDVPITKNGVTKKIWQHDIDHVMKKMNELYEKEIMPISPIGHSIVHIKEFLSRKSYGLGKNSD